MPKQVLKIERFEGGINTHSHKKDINDNSFEVADNVVFDTVGKTRPGGYAEDLGLDGVTAESEPGYGLFSFSHDFTNPDTSTEISKNSNVTVSAKVGFFSQANQGSLGYAAVDGDTSVGGYIKLTDASDSSIPVWQLWNDVPSNNSNTGEVHGGWRYDNTNRVIYCSSSATSNSNYALTAIAGKGKAYFVSVIADGNTTLSDDSDSTSFGSNGYIFAHKGVSLTGGGDTKQLTAGTSATVDIFVMGDTNGFIGIKGDSSFVGRVLKMNVYEVPSPRDTSYLLQQNNRYINLLDTSLTTWRTGLLALHSADLIKVKPQYYIANGNLRVYNSNFSEICENKWYGFVERQNFLDTTIAGVDGGKGFIRQWVEEDQQLYKPNTTDSVTAGDGNPGSYAVEFDTGVTTNFADPADGGTHKAIKIHLGLMDETDATWDTTGSFVFYLSYLYDKSEQESKLTTIATQATATDDMALRVGITVNFDDSGYPFNKRIVGARLYYSDTADSEGFKYHLLDIDFKDGCRTFEDVEFTPWTLGNNMTDLIADDGSNGANLYNTANTEFDFTKESTAFSGGDTYDVVANSLFTNSNTTSLIETDNSSTGLEVTNTTTAKGEMRSGAITVKSGRTYQLDITHYDTSDSGFVDANVMILIGTSAGGSQYLTTTSEDGSFSTTFETTGTTLHFSIGVDSTTSGHAVRIKTIKLKALYKVECPENTVSSPDSDSTTKNFVFSDPPKITWYDVISGYAPDEDTYFRYKTAVIASDKLWAGNIGEVDSSDAVVDRFSDRIIMSPRGRFDLLPRENFLEIAVNDGDEIIKLEAFAGKLLVFKKKMLYIVDIGKDGGEYIESENKFIGISHPASVTKTEGGVAWANDRGVFVYDGRQLVNITDNKINSEIWKAYIGKEPLIGFIPHRKQLFVVRDASSTNDSSFYVYDFQTKSWSRNVGGMGTDSKSNLINAEDTTEVFNGSPIYSTMKGLATDEQIELNQAFSSYVDATDAYDADASVTPNAAVIAAGAPAVKATGHILVGTTGSELFTSIGGLRKQFRFYYGGTDIAINTSGVATTGDELTDYISASEVGNLGSVVNNEGDSVSGETILATFLSNRISAYQGTGLYTASSSGQIITIEQVTASTSHNGKKIRWSHNGTGDYVLQTGSLTTLFGSTISGGRAVTNHVSQVAIHGVDGATTNKFQFKVKQHNLDAWNNGDMLSLIGDAVTIEHIGGTDTTYFSGGSTGDDTSNILVAQDLRAKAAGNSKLTDDFGIEFSGVAVAEENTTVKEDVNGENVYFFSMSSAHPFRLATSGNGVFLYETIKKFTNENVYNVGGYKLITKEFDFGMPSVRKKIYKIWITFKCTDKDGSYADSGVKVYYGTDGKDLIPFDAGTEFSSSKSKYYDGTGGLTAFDSTSSLNTTLNDSGGINATVDNITFTDVSNIHKTGAIKIDDEQILIDRPTTINTSTNVISDITYRGYYVTDAASHDDGADVLVARTDQYVTAELKPSSSINNVKSFQLKLQSYLPVPAKFEISDITIVYRMKNIR